ncbi:Mss4-like protein, partial [Aspergillus sergii]
LKRMLPLSVLVRKTNGVTGYEAAIKEHLSTTNPDRVPVFGKALSEYVNNIIHDWRNFQYFVGPSLKPDGLVAILRYREDDVTPYLIFWKDGLRAANC